MIDINGDKTEAVKLWDSFREGDINSFSLLYKRYFDSLYNYGKALISDEDTVKDCIQDLFIKLYRNRKRLPALSYPKIYMLSSLKNIIIDTLSRNKRIGYITRDDLSFLYSEYQSNRTSSEEDEERELNFDTIICVLNNRQKEAVYLRFMEGLSYDGISHILGITSQSARNLIHRSILKIREKQAEMSKLKS